MPKGRARRSLEDRFWPKVEKSDGCWRWLGSLDVCGYGQIMFRRDDDTVTMAKAHRVSLMLSGVDVPADCEVCHRCNNTWCVRPDHLYVGDHVSNMVDMAKAGSQKGVRNPGSRLDEGKVGALRWLASIGLSQNDLAFMFDVRVPAVSRIIARKRWSHV